MWKIYSHLNIECHQEFETQDDALIEMHRMSEELANEMGDDVFHDPIGLSTVWDDENDEYWCFWISQE